MPSIAHIAFENVSYRLDSGRTLLSNLNLSIERGETLMLLGSSGSGKTTTLKLINRLLTPSTGRVLVDGRPTTEWDAVALRRCIGYAIQEIGLFPHYTVAQNIALLPKLERWPRPKIDARVREVLELVGLPADSFATRYPHQLSGGQRQRVGLARALSADPPILLMDEPFGALDPVGRTQLQRDFQALKQRLGKTVVFVTHDVAEALTLADRIALLHEGELRGLYTPGEFRRTTDPIASGYLSTLRASAELMES
jgi:osmoprotectant transport system ATP-binding protein